MVYRLFKNHTLYFGIALLSCMQMHSASSSQTQLSNIQSWFNFPNVTGMQQKISDKLAECADRLDNVVRSGVRDVVATSQECAVAEAPVSNEMVPSAVVAIPPVVSESETIALNPCDDTLSHAVSVLCPTSNCVVIGAAVAALVVVLAGTLYWYQFCHSWKARIDALIKQAQFDSNAMLPELENILQEWSGTAQEDKIIEYIQNHLVLTPELIALLEGYKKQSI